jgi:hypothetical protein
MGGGLSLVVREREIVVRGCSSPAPRRIPWWPCCRVPCPAPVTSMAPKPSRRPPKTRRCGRSSAIGSAGGATPRCPRRRSAWPSIRRGRPRCGSARPGTRGWRAGLFPARSRLPLGALGVPRARLAPTRAGGSHARGAVGGRSGSSLAAGPRLRLAADAPRSPCWRWGVDAGGHSRRLRRRAHGGAERDRGVVLRRNAPVRRRRRRGPGGFPRRSRASSPCGSSPTVLSGSVAPCAMATRTAAPSTVSRECRGDAVLASRRSAARARVRVRDGAPAEAGTQGR